jgi:mannose-1-phosphate guanylyltransferase
LKREPRLYAAILAGGKGERFWPLSRRSYPKQFLSVFGDKPMLEETLSRIEPLVAPERTLIMTGDHLVPRVAEMASRIPKENVLGEPISKNTAPPIGLAALALDVKEPGCVMAVLPADHLIKDRQAFLRDLRKAAEVALRENRLVTFGIRPTRPETGYGYVRIGSPLADFSEVYDAAGFREKPNIKQAGQLLAAGDYLWNSGIFVWTTTAILQAMGLHLPSLRRGLEEIRASMGGPAQAEAVGKFYSSAQKISIDYGVMEKARNVAVVEASFDWDDVGSWLSMERLEREDSMGNVVRGVTKSLSTENSIVVCEDGLVATLGVSGLLVVRTKDVTLVCRKDRAGEIGKFLEEMKDEEEFEKFL